MKYSLTKFVFAFVILFFSGHTVPAQNFPVKLGSLFTEVADDSQLHFNGTVLVADDGKVIYQNAKGYSDINHHRLNSSATRFQLASLSKVFTATAVMQLAEKGNLKLDD